MKVVAFIEASIERLRKKWLLHCLGTFVPRLMEITKQLEELDAGLLRERAVSILDNPEEYHVVKSAPGQVNEDDLQLLGPETLNFFRIYELVEPLEAETLLSRSLIARSKSACGYVTIGMSSDASPLLIREGEDRVYLLYEGQKLGDELETHRTLYHLILFEYMSRHETIDIVKDLVT